MCELRGYLYTCSAWLNDESDASDENITGNNEPTHDEKETNINHAHLSHSNSNDFGITGATLPLGDTNNGQVHEITVPSIRK